MYQVVVHVEALRHARDRIARFIGLGDNGLLKGGTVLAATFNWGWE